MPTTPYIPCPPGWSDSENKCFKLFRYTDSNDKLDWYEAESYCKKLNGNLASFTSIKQIDNVLANNGIFSFNDVSIWIGLNKISGGYEWSDGTPSGFFYWDFNQPDDMNGVQNCVELKANSRWRSAFCYVNKDWLCSLPKGVNPNEGAITPESSIESKEKIPNFEISGSDVQKTLNIFKLFHV